MNTKSVAALLACPSCAAKAGEDCLNDEGRPVPWRHLDRMSAAFALGEVRYVGVGTDENGRDTWDYRCLACDQKWHLAEPLPRTRGHRCEQQKASEGA